MALSRGFLKIVAVLVTCYCLTLSLGKDIRDKRSAEGLYDNIYSAIAEFTADEEQNQNEKVLSEKDLIEASETLPEQVRTSRNAQGNNFFGGSAQQQLPRAGRQRTVIVDGFPAGLPEGTPEGVKIALASTLPGDQMPPIPGEAGVDFPVYTTVPDTGFDCNGQQFLPGIYADAGADCQVFYMCQADGNFNAFLCPNGTIFNQQYFICDWWYNVDCSAVQNFYPLNEFLYQDQPEGSFQFDGSVNNLNTLNNNNGDNFVGTSFASGSNGASSVNVGSNNQPRGSGSGAVRPRPSSGGSSSSNNNNLPGYSASNSYGVSRGAPLG